MKNMLKLLIVLLGIFCVACQQVDKSTIEENEIVIQIIPELLNPIKPLPPVLDTSIMKQEQGMMVEITNQQQDRIKQWADTTTFYFYLQDFLFIPAIENIDQLSDTMYSGLVAQFKSSNLTRKTLDIDYINSRLDYQVKNLKSFKIEGYSALTKRDGYLGTVCFSRIVFNGDYNKALLYLEFGYDESIGSGNIFYLEKENGNWLIAEQNVIWTM